MVFPVVGGTQDTGYEIQNSLRFNDDDSPKVSRSISSSGSARNATLSVWEKRGNLGENREKKRLSSDRRISLVRAVLNRI